MSMVERLRALLSKRFERRPWEKVELLTPGEGEKWIIAVRLSFDIFITAYKNGKIKIDAGPEPTRSEISEFYLWKKYKQKYEKAMTEEEKKEIKQKKDEEENRILEDFKQKKFEDYLKAKGAISYFAKTHVGDRGS